MTLTDRNREFGNDIALSAWGDMNHLAHQVLLSGRLKDSETLEYLKAYLENYRDQLSRDGLYIGLHHDPGDRSKIHLRLRGLDFQPHVEQGIHKTWYGE